jgi:hypothetical protein
MTYTELLIESIMALRDLRASFADEPMDLWKTIGGHAEGGKQHAGGTPVKISPDGKIVAGPARLQGKKVDELGKKQEPAKEPGKTDKPPEKETGQDKPESVTTKFSVEQASGLRKGDIIRHDGWFYRVAKLDRKGPSSWYDSTTNKSGHEPPHFAVQLTKSSEEKYQSRPVRLAMPSHEVERFGYAPCRKTESGEWAKIDEVKYRSVSGAAGTTRVYFAHGHIVSEAKAQKLNAAYEKAESAKSEASRLRQTADYR